MSDTITLPRAVALYMRDVLRGIINASDDDCGEEKCDDCAPVRVMRETMAVLEAALAEPDAEREPVHPGYIIGSHWLETAYSRIAAGEAEAEVLAEVLGERGWVRPDAIAQAVEAEREAICQIIHGLCVSDNNAQEIVNAISARRSK